MYIEKKKIWNKNYYYLKLSVRDGNKVKTKTIAYLGKKKPSDKEKARIIKRIPDSKIKMIKEALKSKTIKTNEQFLTIEELNKLNIIKKDFNKKLKRLDKNLIDDMFKDFRTYYIYNTNAIEGNTLTLEETNLLLNENKSPEGKDLREIYDHINEKETFDFILKDKSEINHELIIKIHSMLLNKIDKRIGSYRFHNVRVFGALFEPSPAEYVKADMNILIGWYSKNKNKIHPLILSALFHEKFERIHPFYDGNGRTGRMLSNLILIRKGFPPLIIENKKRLEYYKALSIAHKDSLTGMDRQYYKQIVGFFYKQLIKTYEKIFSRWGDVVPKSKNKKKCSP